MKILITNENRGPGGGERYTVDLVKGLKARGHEVVLAGRRGSWLLHQLPGQELHFASEMDLLTLGSLRKLARGCDVVHCQANRDLALCGLLPSRVRLFKSEHTFLESTRSWLLQRAYQRSHVLAVSTALRDQVSQQLPGVRVSELPNGVDLRDYDILPEALPRLQQGRWVGCIAGLLPGKGQDDLIVAFARLDDPDLRLLIAGEGPERARLEALAEPLGDRVWFSGHLEDPRRALAGLSVAVVPSYKETFSLACLEALAAGVPLVACRTGGIPQVVGDAALLVEPGRPEQLAKALKQALRTPPAGGRERAREFSQDRMLDRLLALYEA